MDIALIEFYDVLTGVGIGIFSLLLSSYIVIWYLKNNIILEDLIIDITQILLNNVNTDENIQKNLYTIGALIGSGISNGSGLKQTATRGGKFNLNNLLAEIATQFFTKSLNAPQQNAVATIENKKDNFFNSK